MRETSITCGQLILNKRPHIQDRLRYGHLLGIVKACALLLRFRLALHSILIIMTNAARVAALALFLQAVRVSANLNQLAKAAGKLYFGSATDNSELSDSAYKAILYVACPRHE